MQSFAFAMAAGSRSSMLRPATAAPRRPVRVGPPEAGCRVLAPMLSPSPGDAADPRLSSDLDARPLLDDAGDGREVGIGAEARLRHRQHLQDRAAGDGR